MSVSVNTGRQLHGKGKAVLRAFGRESSFAELSYTYPLKLLSPRLPSAGTHPVSVAYILSYGGGLVPGDSIDLEIDVGPGAALMLLTQGSTKVFRTRAEEHNRRLASGHPTPAPTSDTVQRMAVSIGDDGLLLLLADPVTCFRAASYMQHQTFRLAPRASAVVLDWFTAGRMSRGEEWAFAKYHSVNEVWQGGRRVARDATLLEQPLKDRLAPYACYATVLMFGPTVAPVVAKLKKEYDSEGMAQMQRGGPPGFMWSMSVLEGGCVVRAAGEETEVVREWLRNALSGFAVAVGSQVYSKAFV